MRSWWPNREGGGWAATLCPTPVRQSVVGGFQFRHPLAKRVPLVGDNPRGIDQRLVIAAKSPELFQDAVQGCTQRRQLAAERFVALFTLSQLLPEQRVIHDGSIISASRKTSSAKRLRHRRDFCVGAGACAPSYRRTANLLSGSHLVTLTTLGSVQIDAADHHRQRHAVDFDRQRSGVPATGQLETPAFFAQTTRPSRSP